jgi:hypothetical protein
MAVARRMPPRPQFASFGFRTSAPERIALIVLDLSERGQ